MKKLNHTSYLYIVKAKEIIAEAQQEFNLGGEEFIDEIVFNLHRVRKQMPRRAYIAVICVIFTGGIYGNSFMMPATKDCCQTYKYVEKRLRRGLPLYTRCELGWDIEPFYKKIA